MNALPKVSIVVPVYNIEDYLEKCVDSLLTQTEPDFELLLVDDGSTDGSGALCDRLAERDARIQVLHQKNQGQGGARNNGIRRAAGEYLLLVDSDDWLEPDALEKTLNAARRCNADVVVFGFTTVNEQGQVLETTTEALPKEKPLSPRTKKEILLVYPSPWGKLYRRALFTDTGLEYPTRVWYEDARLTPKLLAAAERVVFLDYLGYDYVLRAGSTMRNTNLNRNGEILDAVEDLLGYFQAQGLFDVYRDELCYLTFSHLYDAAVRVLRQDSRHPLVPRFAAYLTEHFPNYRENRYMTRLDRRHRLILFLLRRRMYGTIHLIFRGKN